jgi:hypothetical protein
MPALDLFTHGSLMVTPSGKRTTPAENMPATTSPAIAAVSPESGSVDQCKPAAGAITLSTATGSPRW